MKRTALVFAIIAGAAWAAVPARACSINTPLDHVVDPALQATDRVAPTLAPLGVPRITRGKDAQAGCASSEASSCDDIGAVSIPIQATDDQTPSDQIGYHLSLVAGSLPGGASIPGRAIKAWGDLLGVIVWVDGARDDQEPIDFTVLVVAIDLAGNESAPQIVRVTDDPGGCTIAGLRRPTAALVGLAAAALLAVRRRRQRAS